MQALTGAVALEDNGAGATLVGGIGGGGNAVMTALGLGAASTSGNAVTCTVPRLGGSRMAPMDTPLDEPPLSSPCNAHRVHFKACHSLAELDEIKHHIETEVLLITSVCSDPSASLRTQHAAEHTILGLANDVAVAPAGQTQVLAIATRRNQCATRCHTADLLSNIKNGLDRVTCWSILTSTLLDKCLCPSQNGAGCCQADFDNCTGYLSRL